MSGPENETLPEELVWAEGGHASDVALTTLADGQATLLPAAVLAHVQGCTSCTQHLGHAALLSLHVAREMGTVVAHERALATTRRPIPWVAVALGLTVAVLALLPSLADLGSSASFGSFWTTASLVTRVVRTVARGVLSPGSALGLFVTCGTAVALVVSALVVVKLLPRKDVSS